MDLEVLRYLVIRRLLDLASGVYHLLSTSIRVRKRIRLLPQAERERMQTRPSTPFRRQPGSDKTVRPTNSRSSIRSNRSGRSHRSHRSRHREGEVESDSDSDAATVGAYAQTGPSGSRTQASAYRGAGGEPVEITHLGRKEPRHRSMSANALRSALRGSSSSNNINVNTASRGRPGPAGLDPRHKPLSNAPFSYITPIVDSFVSPYEPRGSSNHPSHGAHSRHASQPHISGIGSGGGIMGLRSLFSALTVDPSSVVSTNDHHGSPPRSRSRRSSKSSSSIRQQNLVPAEDLYGYLALADIPSWNDWSGNESSSSRRNRSSLSLLGGDLFGGRTRGFESMPWEWRRRWEDAEMGRPMRVMRMWEVMSVRLWDKKILECECFSFVWPRSER